MQYYFLMPWQGWLVTLFGILLFPIPSALIIRRMGFSAWWALLFFVPGAILVGLWILALANWPALPKPQNSN